MSQAKFRFRLHKISFYKISVFQKYMEMTVVTETDDSHHTLRYL